MRRVTRTCLFVVATILGAADPLDLSRPGPVDASSVRPAAIAADSLVGPSHAAEGAAGRTDPPAPR